MRAQEPSTPSTTTTSRRSSTQLQPLRPTRLFQLGAPSTSNSTSASTQSSRHPSIIPSPGSSQLIPPTGNFSLPDLREIEQCTERSETGTPIPRSNPIGHEVAFQDQPSLSPLMGPVDRAVQSFHDLRLTNEWQAYSLKPGSVERHQAEKFDTDRDTPKARSTASLLPGFQYPEQISSDTARSSFSRQDSKSREDSRGGHDRAASIPSTQPTAPQWLDMTNVADQNRLHPNNQVRYSYLQIPLFFYTRDTHL